MLLFYFILFYRYDKNFTYDIHFMIIAYRFEPQIPYLNFLSNTSEAKTVEWASYTLFMGSISVSIANKVLEERDGDWVIMFQLWGFLSIKSSLLRKKKLTSSPKHLIRVFWKLTLWSHNFISQHLKYLVVEYSYKTNIYWARNSQ